MNENNYTSPEMSRKLVGAEIAIDTDVYWHEYVEHFMGTFAHIKEEKKFFLSTVKTDIPAPSMAELWRELPEGTRVSMAKDFTIAAIGDTYGYKPHGCKVFSNTNPCDALAELRIWLLNSK